LLTTWAINRDINELCTLSAQNNFCFVCSHSKQQLFHSTWLTTLSLQLHPPWGKKWTCICSLSQEAKHFRKF
jgi:hypothetical protein